MDIIVLSLLIIVVLIAVWLVISFVRYRTDSKHQIAGSFWTYCIPFYKQFFNREGSELFLQGVERGSEPDGGSAEIFEGGEDQTLHGPMEEKPAEEIIEKKQYKMKRSLSSYIKQVPLVSGFFSRQVTELVGVDIGTTTIKVCSLKNTKGFLTVENVVLKTYDQDLLNDGHVVDIDFLAHELKTIFEENKIKSRNVACALSSYSVISKKITIPFLDDEELEKTIGAEVENAIPFPMHDIYYSYYVMGADAEKQNMMNVKIVAAKKEIVDGYITAFNMADLTLHVLDVDIFGISNFVEQIYSPKEFSVVIVDIGASVTNIAILNGEEIEFTREILVGGKYLTNLIQKSARLNYKNAEEKKLSADSNIAYLFEDFIFNIASEVNKTIRFYLATKPKENIGKIYVTGGSSLLPGLKEKIVEDSGIQVEVINPFLMVQSGDVGNETYENLKEFMVVPLYLSTRITDII
jgi:type IV pilus assembly protein PilM